MREGRVLSRRSPSTPSAANRSCQRQTQVLDLPVSRMIAFVPTPSALSNTIRARQTCFCGALRSLTRARSRSRSAVVTEIEMPVRIPKTRTPQVRRESLSGFKCQTSSTRWKSSGAGSRVVRRPRRGERAGSQNLPEMSCWKSELVIRLKDSRPVGPSYGGYGHVAVVEARRKLQKVAPNALKTLNRRPIPRPPAPPVSTDTGPSRKWRPKSGNTSSGGNGLGGAEKAPQGFEIA